MHREAISLILYQSFLICKGIFAFLSLSLFVTLNIPSGHFSLVKGSTERGDFSALLCACNITLYLKLRFCSNRSPSDHRVFNSMQYTCDTCAHPGGGSPPPHGKCSFNAYCGACRATERPKMGNLENRYAPETSAWDRQESGRTKCVDVSSLSLDTLIHPAPQPGCVILQLLHP